MNENLDYPWYALRVRSNFEKTVATHLEDRGYAPFLPLYNSRRTWSDRLKEIELPLFPGYMFCRFSVLNRLPILTTPGVVTIIGAGKKPIPVEESEISALQAICSAKLPAQPWPYLNLGQHVVIERGALRGVEGILLDYRKTFRLVLSVTLLQRSVAVEIDREWVRPIANMLPPRRQATGT